MILAHKWLVSLHINHTCKGLDPCRNVIQTMLYRCSRPEHKTVICVDTKDIFWWRKESCHINSHFIEIKLVLMYLNIISLRCSSLITFCFILINQIGYTEELCNSFLKTHKPAKYKMVCNGCVIQFWQLWGRVVILYSLWLYSKKCNKIVNESKPAKILLT